MRAEIMAGCFQDLYRILKEEMDKEFAHMSAPDGQTDADPKHTSKEKK